MRTRETGEKAQSTFAGNGALLGMLQDKSQVCAVPDIYDYDDPDLHAIWADQVVLPDRSASRLVWDDEQQEA